MTDQPLLLVYTFLNIRILFHDFECFSWNLLLFTLLLRAFFEQLNSIYTDMDESVSDLDMTGLDNTATVTISNVANTLNLFTGETSFISDGASEGEKGKVVIPATAFPTKIDGKHPTINVDGVVYEVISMNYVLVADAGSQDGKTTVDLQLKVGELVDNVPNAYMKRNWRTNVVGELLTAEGSFKVSLDPDFNGSYNEFWNSGMSSESKEE